MACACKGRKNVKYLWFKNEGEFKVFDSAIQAKAKVQRKGGFWIEIQPNEPLTAAVARAAAKV